MLLRHRSQHSLDHLLGALAPNEVAESTQRYVTSLAPDRLLRLIYYCVFQMTSSERAYFAFMLGESTRLESPFDESAPTCNQLLARINDTNVDLPTSFAAFLARNPRALHTLPNEAIKAIIEPVIDHAGVAIDGVSVPEENDLFDPVPYVMQLAPRLTTPRFGDFYAATAASMAHTRMETKRRFARARDAFVRGLRTFVAIVISPFVAAYRFCIAIPGALAHGIVTLARITVAGMHLCVAPFVQLYRLCVALLSAVLRIARRFGAAIVRPLLAVGALSLIALVSARMLPLATLVSKPIAIASTPRHHAAPRRHAASAPRRHAVAPRPRATAAPPVVVAQASPAPHHAPPQRTRRRWKFNPDGNPYINERPVLALRPAPTPAPVVHTPSFLDRARAIVASDLAVQSARYRVVDATTRDDGSAKVDVEFSGPRGRFFGVYTVAQSAGAVAITDRTVIPVSGPGRLP